MDGRVIDIPGEGWPKGRAPISVCIMVRNEEASGLLDACLQSVRPHVEEIVILDTGSTDGTPDIARKYADVFEVYTGCNDPETGVIADFADARNKSFSLATKRWVMWMDSDDVLRGGEHLAKLVAVGDANRGERDWCYLFPYEYVYDERGRCICLHYRERLLSRAGAMTWQNRVHEVMIPSDPGTLTIVPCEDIVLEHHRQRSKKPQESGRNLRILQKMVEEEGSKDPRQFYYLGLEYANANNHDKAVEWLSRYVGISGWDHEKTMAALKLAEIAYAQGRIQEGIVWSFRAIEVREDWGECYFAAARGFYQLAVVGTDTRRNWQKCAHFGRVGLSLPPTKTMLFVNPIERDLDIHVYLTMAYSQLGDAHKALEHADIALKQSPNDPNLVYNRKVFERLIARDEARTAMRRLAAATDAPPEAVAVALAEFGDADGPSDGWARFSRPATYPRGVEKQHFPTARRSPHARAFAIPETVDIEDLPVILTDAQVEAATIMLWKEYVLHDEILAAEQFLANAPYRARHTPTVEAALARTRKMTAWMDAADTTQQYNAPADPTVETGVPLPLPLNGQLLDRSDLTIATLKKTDKVLDFGCSDGSIINRWGLQGYDVTGVDLCESSVALAKRKAEEFETGCRFHVGKFSEVDLGGETFDVVTSCDTYEHVKDHVRDIIAPARRTLKEGGRMVLVTPHGSWMRGEYVPWAHPWRWADEENQPWNAALPHAHLIAPTVWSVAGHFREDGWWVKDSYIVESASHQDVPGQGNVYCEARLEPPKCTEKMLDIVFACGDAWQNWNPLIHKTQGIGGSETMVVELAKRLSLLGHRVRVFTSTGKWGEGIFDGVEYRQSGHLPLAGSCDVLVAWRDASLLDVPVTAKTRLLWVHDIFAGNGRHASLLRADAVLGLSEWHCDFIEKHHNLPREQVIQTRNGIDLSRFDKPVERNTKKVVYSSSPDRGLPVLLKVWPEIRKRVPDATLDIFYGFFNWKKMAQARGDQDQLKGIAFLEKQIQDLGPHGVTMRGKVDQQTLADEFLSAGVWAYPTWFSETSCITAMEAQAAGLRIVTSSIAALKETVGEYGVLIDGDWLSPEYQATFIDEVVAALVAPETEWITTRYALTMHARKAFGLDALAEDWVAMMRDEIERVKVSPLVPYQPRADFAREAA